MKERMILFTFLVAACSLILRAVDVVEVTAAGKEAVRYAAIEDALGTCSGGETLTLLGDVAVPGKLEISKSVTVDLAGYTLKNGSGWFICPTEDVGTLSFRNRHAPRLPLTDPRRPRVDIPGEGMENERKERS